MPEPSPYKIRIPETDIVSWLFPASKEPSTTPIFFDAAETSVRLSPAQLLTWIRRVGCGLQRWGLHPGDVVLLHSTNHIFVPVAYYGIIAAGGVFSAANPAYGPSEVEHQIKNSGARIILADPALVDTTLAAADRAGFPSDHVFLFDDKYTPPYHSIWDWQHLLASESESKQWQWKALQGPDFAKTVAVLNYSSGTTGLPKGVMVSHQNVIANVEQTLYMRRLKDASPSSLQSEKPDGPERWLGFLPLYHAYGQLWSMSAALRNSTPVYFMRSFSYPTWLSHVARHRITHIQTAPPLLVLLAKRPETAKFDLSSLRNIMCGAAPLSKELQNEVMDKIGTDLKVVQTMGMTELTCCTLQVPGLMKDDSGSVGLADPNCVIKLVNDDGHEVGDNERGEICVRGPNVCLGYWRNKEATAALFDDEGYLHSGDIAIRKNGWYWIVDRKKELIKVRGFQVAPAELEAVLLENEAVADAAVVALAPGEGETEEKPRAYVTLKEHAQGRVSEDEIVKWTAGRVARHKQLTGGVAFVEEVPKSPSGKIQRVTMREWAKRDAERLRKQGKPKL